MEKTLTETEKIRRAGEIAYRRKYTNEYPEAKHKKTYLGSKILLQILIIFNITIIVYCIQNQNEIFKDEFLSKINIQQLDIKAKVEDFYNSIVSTPNDATIFENNQSEETNTVIVENEEIQNSVGGIVVNEPIEDNANKSESEFIKEKFDLIKPISGTVTSSFGERESDNKKIAGFHTGTDIAAINGTDIVSAVDGEVILVSDQGDYGKHIKIQNSDLITLYAHCSKILVSEGTEVKKGEKIAEVGSTGNSTGPHLHFEMIYQNKKIDPEEIFEF